MYYILCVDIKQSPSMLLTDESSCHGPVWQTGRSINSSDNDLSQLVFMSESPHVQHFPDLARDNHGCLLFSEKMKNLMISEGVENLEYYAARIIEYNKEEEVPGFYAVNIVGLLALLDREKSRYRERMGKIAKFTELVVNEAATQEMAIFRLEEIPRVILVNEKLKEAIEDAGITGVQCIAPNRWDGFDGYKT